MGHCHACVSSHCILPVCLGQSESRICTVFTCFTPELDHVNKSLLLKTLSIIVLISLPQQTSSCFSPITDHYWWIYATWWKPMYMVLMLDLFCRVLTSDGMELPSKMFASLEWTVEHLKGLMLCNQTALSIWWFAMTFLVLTTLKLILCECNVGGVQLLFALLTHPYKIKRQKL